MNKPKYLSSIAALLLFILVFETNAYADAMGVSPFVLGGFFLLIIAIIIGVIGLIAWLIIRSVKKRKKQI